MDENLYQHCLRPLFTKNVVRDLQKYRSLNVYGKNGLGCGRLMRDIQKYPWDSNTKTLLVNMKTCQESYSAFLQTLWQQFAGQGETPTDLGRLMTEFEKSNKTIILLLHHFDSLLDNPNVHQEFNQQFFDNLNAIRNKPLMSLICVTEQPHTQSVIFIGDATQRGSWLELEQKELANLTLNEIRQEVKRQVETVSEDELTQMAEAIYKQDKPYDVLCYFCDKLSNQVDSEKDFSTRLKLWKTQYNKAHPSVTISRADRLKVGINRWLRVTGLQQSVQQFFSDIYQIMMRYLGK